MSTDKAQPDAPSGEVGPSAGIASADPVAPEARSAGAAGDSCPSCDAPGAWSLSSRHRFNPFGGVTCLVLAFWAALLGWLLGFGLLPAGALFLLGITLIAARRTALVCQVCGFVKPGD